MARHGVAFLFLAIIVVGILSLGSGKSSPAIANGALAAVPAPGDSGGTSDVTGAVKIGQANNKQCPAPNATNKYIKTDKSKWNKSITVGNMTIHNLYGKPCTTQLVRGFCVAEKDCSGKLPGAECFDISTGKWGPCKLPGDVAHGGGSTCLDTGCGPVGNGPNNPGGGAASPGGGASGGGASNTQPGGAYGNGGSGSGGAAGSGSGSGGVGSGAAGGGGSVATKPEYQPPVPQGQPVVLGPNNPTTNPYPTGPAQYPTYQNFPSTPPQTTFGGGSYGTEDSGASADGGGGLLSGIASLFGGLLSSPGNGITNFAHALFAPSTPVSAASQPLSAQPVDLSREIHPAIVSFKGAEPLPNDTNIHIVAFANTKTGDSSSASSESQGVEVSNEAHAVAAENSGSTHSAVPPENEKKAISEIARSGDPATQSPDGATSTEATSSTDWKVVTRDVGKPLIVAEPAGIELSASGWQGGWAKQTLSPLQNKGALAQSQTLYQEAISQIGALQELESAGLCNEACVSQIDDLKSGLAERQSRIDQLQSAIDRDEEIAGRRAASNLPAPSLLVSHIMQDVLAQDSSAALSNTPTPHAAIASIAQNDSVGTGEPPAAPASPSAISPSQDETSSQTQTENVIVHAVQKIWNFFTSVFAAKPANAAPVSHCSLFSSFFGGCS